MNTDIYATTESNREPSRIPADVLNAYVLANTPNYLYKKLVSSDYLHSLLETEQIKLVHRLSNANRDDAESVIDAYASLVALCQNGYPESRLLELSKRKLNWAASIIALCKRGNESNTTISQISAPEIDLINSSIHPELVSNSSFSSVIFEGK